MEEPPGGHAAARADRVTRFTAETIAARQARAGAWVLIALGVGCILFGGVFFAVKHSGHNVVATVTHEGPCSNGTCTVDVVYDAAGGQVSAVMYGVNSGEIYGPASRRLLNINYQSGFETSPTTNDMPDGVWIGFGAAGLAFAGWGIWVRRSRKAPPRTLTTAAAGGAPAGAVVTAALRPALADRPGPDGPAHTSARGPRWVADKSGAVTIAERYPRWWAVLFPLVVAIYLCSVFAQHSRTWLARGHMLATVACLIIATAALIWGCSRAWRIGLRLGEGGVMVRNFLRTYRVSWPEVRCFADGSVRRGESGRVWALGIVLRGGRVVTASGTSSGKRDARPETLAAIWQAAEHYAIPAELTGTAGKPGSRGSPANPGLYPDPGGQPGLRRWDGREWSPFLLRADPARGKPDGAKAPAEVWSPLAGSEPQWQDAAARIRRAGTVFAAWLAVTAAAAAVTVSLYARDLSKPQADFTLAVFALIAAVLALIMTGNAWARRKNLQKIDQAGKVAAVLAATGESTASRMRCAECGAQTAEVTQFCAVCGAPAMARSSVAVDPAATGLSDAGDHRGSRARQVAWAVLPVVSFTVLAWWPLLVLALICRRARDWAVFAASLAAVVAEIVTFTLVGTGVVPAAGVATDVAAGIFYPMVLLLAVAAPVYILVTFRPAAALPSLSGARRARAAAKRQQPVMDVGGPEGWQ